MGFSVKIKKYFDDRLLSNREIAKIMDGYSENMVSQFLNSDKLSITFIQLLIKYFPDIDLNYLLKEESDIHLVEESREEYKKRSVEIMEDIKVKLEELEKIVSQK